MVSDPHPPQPRVDPVGTTSPRSEPVGEGLAEPRPRRAHRWGLPAFLLTEAVFLGVSVLLALPFLDPGTGEVRLADVRAFLLVTVVPTVTAAGLALVIVRWRGNGPRLDLGLVWSWRDVAIGLGLGFAGLVLSTVAAAVWITIVGPDVSSALGDALAGHRASLPVALGVLVAIVVVAPFCEEVLYRGLLWGAVEKLGAGPWLTFGITTAVFAFLHFEPLRAPLLLVVAIPIGLARLLTGRLAASIAAHQLNNLLPGVVVFLMLIGVDLPAAA